MNAIKTAVGPILGAALGAGLFFIGVPADRTLIISLIVALFPVAWVQRSEWKEREEIERNLADFLRDLSESIKAGMPVYQAIETAAEGDYGGLTPYVKQMRREILVGISFEEALERFADRAGTPRVNRMVSLVLRASRAGGNIGAVLEAASERARKHVEYTEERRRNTSAYVAIAYVAFFVFLGVIFALTSKFFPAMAEAAKSGASSRFLPGFEKGAYQDAFFYLAVVQAVATGTFAGKVGEGEATAGLKHTAVLVGVALVFFSII